MATELDQPERDSNRAVLTYTADETESLSDAVIVAVRMAAAQVQSVDALDEPVGVVDPLFETVDTDALDALFSPAFDGVTRSGTVTFTHDGFEITAHASGDVRVSRS